VFRSLPTSLLTIRKVMIEKTVLLGTRRGDHLSIVSQSFFFSPTRPRTWYPAWPILMHQMLTFPPPTPQLSWPLETCLKLTPPLENDNENHLSHLHNIHKAFWN
jgi:hypothetical protein